MKFTGGNEKEINKFCENRFFITDITNDGTHTGWAMFDYFDKHVSVNIGDYIFKQSGRWMAMSEAEFLQKYEPVSE